MSNTKKLTEAGLLSSLFVVFTIVSVGSGVGYTLYLDFIVPIYFCLVCIKCDTKYTVLSGITSLIIIGLVLGNLGTAIWSTQSVILGILCGILLSKDTSIMDDLVYGSILGVILMVFIDIYASKLIGYSFMKEFQEYIKILPFKKYSQTIYYLLISTFPFGMVFSVYYISLQVGKKLKIVKGNAKKKLDIMSKFKAYSRFICCSNKVFYCCGIYILAFEILKYLNINIEYIYLKTISICIEYLCMYFVFRDGFITIQNYIISKYKKASIVIILSILVLVSLIYLFKVTLLAIVIGNIILDKKINIRVKQNNILDSLIKQI